MASTESFACPKGHASTNSDYCSECGVRIHGAPEQDLSGSAVPKGPEAQRCPDCGTAREQPEIGFCEVCGYNFRTGAHGEIGVMPSPTEPELVDDAPSPPLEEPRQGEPRQGEPRQGEAATLPKAWRLTVAVDPSLRDERSPEAPQEVEPFTVELPEGTHLIGRPDESRGIHPDIAIRFDEAVSRRHALLQGGAAGQGWTLRDIGAANGTRLNGEEMESMRDYALAPGDEITLGHWTRIRVEAA